MTTELTLDRVSPMPGCTIGHLAWDGTFQCYTLEDTVRAPGIKVPGATAIPPGRYKVIIDFSNRFQKPMPHVLNVPGFEGIRIHCGNTAADTEGCILLGSGADARQGVISGSRIAFDAFFPKLQAALAAGDVFLTIK